MNSVLDFTKELVKSFFKSKCVAPLENDDTISRTYYVGNNFIRDGVLYKAKQTIAVNTAWSTLVLNTHYEEDISIISKLAGKAPTNHASPDTTYGVGSVTDYGHVKVDSVLSDSSINPVQNKTISSQIQALTNEINNTVAYINTNSTTASKNYIAGELFILDGVLRKALVDITVGNTLTINSNYETVNNIGSQLFRFKKIPFTWTPQGQGHKQAVDIIISGLVNGDKIVSATITTGSSNMDATIADIGTNHVYCWIYENTNTVATSLTGYLLVLYYL